MIFQNPYASLNPRMTVQDTLEEPIRFHNPDDSKAEVQEKVSAVMDSVGVDPMWGELYPHEFSGGQRQRISIARALAVSRPECAIFSGLRGRTRLHITPQYTARVPAARAAAAGNRRDCPG